MVETRGVPWFAVLAAVMMLSFSVPGAAASGGVYSPYASTCVQTSTSPPFVYLGRCYPSSPGQGGTFMTQAVGEDLDVNVTWDIEASELDPDAVTHVNMLRGMDPGNMDLVAPGLDPGSGDYVDEDALVQTPGEGWYQVQVVLEDGSTVDGDAVPVSDYRASS